MIKSLTTAAALVFAGAAILAVPVGATSIGPPASSTETLLTPVASKKKYKKYKKRKCRKGKFYSKRRHKCVWRKKRYRTKAVGPAKAGAAAKTVAPAKKK